MAGVQPVSAKGEAEFEQVPPGKYEIVWWGPPKTYSVAHISAEGAEVSGHSFTVTAGSAPAISLTLVGGSLNVEGTAKHAGKPFAGAMVVLVPKNPEENSRPFPPRPKRSRRNLQFAQRSPRLLHHSRDRKRLGAGLVSARSDCCVLESRTHSSDGQSSGPHHDSFGSR